MPYHLSEDGLTVLDESGQAVPGGQHETQDDATAHLQAMNIATADEGDETDKQFAYAHSMPEAKTDLAAAPHIPATTVKDEIAATPGIDHAVVPQSAPVEAPAPANAAAAKHMPGQHDQADHGHRGVLSEKEASALTTWLHTRGGFTYQPLKNVSPRSGMMVSPYKGREKVIDGKAWTQKQLIQYALQNKDLLTKPDHYLGGWADGGKVYLDVSVHRDTADEALALAHKFHQLAYYDIGKGETVYANQPAAKRQDGAAPGAAQGSELRSVQGMDRNHGAGDGRNGRSVKRRGDEASLSTLLGGGAAASGNTRLLTDHDLRAIVSDELKRLLGKAVQDIPGLAHATDAADCGACQFHRDFLEARSTSSTSASKGSTSTTAIPIVYCALYDSKVQCDWTCESWQAADDHPDAQPLPDDPTDTTLMYAGAPAAPDMGSFGLALQPPRGAKVRVLTKGQPMNDQLTIFLPILKIDQQRREVYGYAILEQPDHADEILDYASSKPLFSKWSQDVAKDSGGKSLGNVREMHSNSAAGKLIQFENDDQAKGFYVGARIVDDEAWAKVEEGVYTGFSVGGRYVRRWPDGRLTRYTAEPHEISLVDRPCVPGATYQMIKSAGGQSLAAPRMFHTDGTGQDHLWIVKAANGGSVVPAEPGPIEREATGGDKAKPTDKDIQARQDLNERVQVYPTVMTAREIPRDKPPTGDSLAGQYRPKADLSSAADRAMSATPAGGKQPGVNKATDDGGLDKIKVTGGQNMPKAITKDDASAVLSQVKPIISAVQEQVGRGEVDRALLDQLAAALDVTVAEADDMHTEQTSGSSVTPPTEGAGSGSQSTAEKDFSTATTSGSTPSASTPSASTSTAPASHTPSSGDSPSASTATTGSSETEKPTMSKEAGDNVQAFTTVPPRSNMNFNLSEDADAALIPNFLNALYAGSLRKAQELVGYNQVHFDQMLTKSLQWYMTSVGITAQNVRKLHSGAPADFDPSDHESLQKAMVSTDIPGIYLMRLARLMLPVYAGLVRRLPAATPETGADKAQWRAQLGFQNLSFANNLHVAEGAIGDEITETFLTFAVPYRDLALNDKVTLKATAASRGYDDPLQVSVIRALTALLQLQERKVIGDNAAALATPGVPVGTPSTTGGTLGAGTATVVKVTALSYTGYVGGVKGGALTAGAGETDAGTSAAITTTGATSSIAATWAAVPGAAAYNVYISDPTGANVRWVATTGRTGYTITAYPGSGNAPPSSNYTLQANGYEGLMQWCLQSTIYSNAIPNKVTPVDLAGAALTTNGSGITEFDALLSKLWTQWQISPTLILTSSNGVASYTSKIMTLNMPQYRVDATDKQGQLVGGSFVTYYVNKFAPWADGSLRTIELMAHPYMPDGSYLFLCESIPYPMSRESRGFARDTLIPWTYFPLAQTAINYPFAVTLSEAVECFHPSVQTAIVGANVS